MFFFHVRNCYFRKPLKISTRGQYTRLMRLEFAVNCYKMLPSDDIIQHLIKMNEKIQEAIWHGSSRLTDDYFMFRTLLQSLINPEDKKLLAELWVSNRSSKYDIPLSDFVRAYIKRGARRTATFATTSTTRKRTHEIILYPWLHNIEMALPIQLTNSFPVFQKRLTEEEALRLLPFSVNHIP